MKENRTENFSVRFLHICLSFLDKTKGEKLFLCLSGGNEVGGGILGVYLKLLLGGISAATLFMSNYYGRLSLSRVASDHEKMERFYAAVSDRIDRYGQTDALLMLLAREELIENGNWCSYQRDNSTDFSL